MKKYFLCLIIVFISLTGFSSKRYDEITNYYGISESLNFGGLDYTLSWSSHPNDNYYKQEYIPKDNTADHFKDMVLIDFIIADISIKQAVGEQINVLNNRKKTDAVCNFQVVRNKNTDEYILDFIMSESGAESTKVIEWNAYHYKQYTDKAGHKGILLFGVSHRAYGDEATPFMQSLGQYRNKNLKLLTSFSMPEIQVK